MIVWIPMRPEDSAAAARVSARLYGDHRVDHFYDADRNAGRVIARGLGGEGDVAWDIYLVYPPHSEWGDAPPPSSSWVHQLRESVWAVRARYQTGAGLVSELQGMVRRFLPPA